MFGIRRVHIIHSVAIGPDLCQVIMMTAPPKQRQGRRRRHRRTLKGLGDEGETHSRRQGSISRLRVGKRLAEYGTRGQLANTSGAALWKDRRSPEMETAVTSDSGCRFSFPHGTRRRGEVGVSQRGNKFVSSLHYFHLLSLASERQAQRRTSLIHHIVKHAYLMGTWSPTFRKAALQVKNSSLP